MSRRIDIELTSQTGDGSWTWRAAGARQPKGAVDGALVPAGEKVGAVLRADVDVGLEGIEILSLTATKPARSPEKTEGRIEVKGTPKRAPDVSVVLAPGSGKRRARRRRRPWRARRRPGTARRRPAHCAHPTARPTAARDEHGERPALAADRAGPVGDAPATAKAAPARGERPVTPTSTVHRNAMLAALRPEQIPVAEQLLRGGLQAVRQAIEAQNTAAKAAAQASGRRRRPHGHGRRAPARRPAGGLEGPRLGGPDGRARTTGCASSAPSSTASRTVNLDEEARAMAKALQESLDQRTTALREEWLARITNALNDGRVLQAVEASIRPPEPGTRCPAELAVRLAGAAGEAMTADAGARGLDAPARCRGGVPGAPDGQAGGHPRRRGGPSGGAPCGGIGPGPGQAARAPHPAPAAAAGEHGAPLQSNRRLSVSRRAVNPAASRRCLVVRSPGSASASISVQPQPGAPVHRGIHERRPDADAPGARLHVAALDQAGLAASGPFGPRRRPGGRPRPPRTPPPRGGCVEPGRVQRSSSVTGVASPTSAAPPRMDGAATRAWESRRVQAWRSAARPAGPAPSALVGGRAQRPLVEQLAGPVEDGAPVAGAMPRSAGRRAAPRGPGSRAAGRPGRR